MPVQPDVGDAGCVAGARDRLEPNRKCQECKQQLVCSVRSQRLQKSLMSHNPTSVLRKARRMALGAVPTSCAVRNSK